MSLQNRGRMFGTRCSAALAVLMLAAAPAARAQQVYVGSGNGWKQMSAHPEQWEYVRHNSDGFYINFIELLHQDAAAMSGLSSAFTHKNAYFESDSRYTGLGGFPDGGQFSQALQGQEMKALLEGGFHVSYTSLNYGLDAVKENDLKHLGLPPGQTRPCLTQCGPWTYGGDISGSTGSAPIIRANIDRSEGASTDGPLSLWQTDQGHMRSGSFSLVKYVHARHKTAAVMVAPYNLKPRSQWLSVAQQCVRQHEDAGAKPDIWIVFEYATDTPTLPETVGNRPADTITGMAYWLIHHVKDPQHWARLSPAPPTPVADENPSRRETTVTVSNHSADMDLCPVLFAHVRGDARAWDVRFRLNGRDVTRQMTDANGLAFVGGLRLWPGDRRQIQVVMNRRRLGGPEQAPVIEIGLHPNPSAKTRVNQLLTLRPWGRFAPHASTASHSLLRMVQL